MRNLRHVLSTRRFQVLAVVAVLAVAAIVLDRLRLIPSADAEAEILVVDLRHGLPDTASRGADGLRSVSLITVLRALDAAQHDRRIVGAYLRLGGRGMTVAQGSEIAEAVLRLRRTGKFAVAYAEGFTAANLSDRMLAAVADEIWTSRLAADEERHPPESLAPGADWANRLPGLESSQGALWRELLDQTAERIRALSSRPEPGAESSLEALSQAPGPAPVQHRRGPEAQAEGAALAWGGADAKFLGLPVYRDRLDRRASSEPMVALIQAEGILDTLEGPGPRVLAGPLAERIRSAAQDGRVAGIVVRLSAVAASDEALSLLVEAAKEARVRGTPAGISFGPFIPARAAALAANVPMSAAQGALVVNLASHPQAAEVAGHLWGDWRSAASAETPATRLPAEAILLQSKAAVATVPARRGAEANEAPPMPGTVTWRNDVGSLLEIRDRITDRDAATGDALPIVPYESRPSVWTRTKSRFKRLWMWLTRPISRKSEQPAP